MRWSVGWLGRETMSEDERRHAAAHHQGVPFVHLDPHAISYEVFSLIPEPLAREHSVVAYSLGERGVEVALLDLSALDALEFLRAKYRVLPRLTTREALTRALLRYQAAQRERYGAMLSRPGPNLLETLLRHALASGVSDVHIQSDDQGLLVRYRIGSSLKPALMLPAAVGAQVVASLRALAKLPKGELPRETRLRVELDEPVVVRVASLPVVGGEKLTLHLSREKARRGWTLESIGLHGEGLERLHQTLLKRRGLLLVSGGTQSGKTSLLYTLLDLLNTPELSIASIEQEVSEILPRVSQTSLSRSGMSVAAAARAALRQDCDVLMIDAPLDREAVELAESAAARGIFVIVATSDESLFSRAATVVRTAVVRKLCAKHFLDKKKMTRAEADALEAAGADFAKVLAALKEEGRVGKDTAWKDVTFPRAAGCSECEDGYQGLLGIQQVLQEHYESPNLLEDALLKAVGNQTSLQEVARLA